MAQEPDGTPTENDDRDTLLASMQDICACDEATARQCLERCDWSLQVAVQEYLNFEEGGHSVFSQEGQENQANAAQEQQLRRRPVQPGASAAQPVFDTARSFRPVQLSSAALRRLGPSHRPIGWFDYIWAWLCMPFRFVYTSIFDILRFFYAIFFRRPLAVTDPEGDVRNFIEQYENKYGITHPMFTRNSYSAALTDAKKELKFVLVYLHSDSHQDTDRFCRETLADQDLIQFVNQNMNFWACSVNTPEGYRASMALRESTFPFLALICFRDNRMAMVMRLEGCYAPNEVTGALAVAIQDNEPYLRAARLEREQHELNQRLRMEQEMAYEETLTADREKRVRKLAQEKQLENEMIEQKEAEAREEQRRKRLIEFRKQIANSLREEPELDSLDPECVRISLKFPTGSRSERRFHMSDGVEYLFRVAFIHADCPENFSLVCSYPRKVLEKPDWLNTLTFDQNQPSSSNHRNNYVTLADAGLEKAVVILVQNDDA